MLLEIESWYSCYCVIIIINYIFCGILQFLPDVRNALEFRYNEIST